MTFVLHCGWEAINVVDSGARWMLVEHKRKLVHFDSSSRFTLLGEKPVYVSEVWKPRFQLCKWDVNFLLWNSGRRHHQNMLYACTAHACVAGPICCATKLFVCSSLTSFSFGLSGPTQVKLCSMQKELKNSFIVLDIDSFNLWKESIFAPG